MSSLEDQLNKAIGELQLLDQLINEVRARITALQAIITEHEGALSFIEELLKSDSNMKILVPIGGGNYVHAEIIDKDKVEVSIGAGVIITKSPQEGKEIIEKRRETLLQAVQNYEQRLQQYLNRAEELRRVIEAISAKLRMQKGQE
ncbi:MAG: prefoldin subunit alpha [Thaumarchaeota archaeon]|jgi:prefoldin alpha subunit|nr:prefoldin subunit alpha [Candidatus Geocrenenecus arthurdayi]MCL7389360.1 prefoldin subunit alpha [Candidatus Geocrenenecus arthurdayi]MCL7397147.1 prefoldin subunit alpha [Candidatus Geocrenenecus arthurdayi]